MYISRTRTGSQLPSTCQLTSEPFASPRRVRFLAHAHAPTTPPDSAASVIEGPSLELLSLAGGPVETEIFSHSSFSGEAAASTGVSGGASASPASASVPTAFRRRRQTAAPTSRHDSAGI